MLAYRPDPAQARSTSARSTHREASAPCGVRTVWAGGCCSSSSPDLRRPVLAVPAVPATDATRVPQRPQHVTAQVVRRPRRVGLPLPRHQLCSLVTRDRSPPLLAAPGLGGGPGPPVTPSPGPCSACCAPPAGTPTPSATKSAPTPSNTSVPTTRCGLWTRRTSRRRGTRGTAVRAPAEALRGFPAAMGAGQPLPDVGADTDTAAFHRAVRAPDVVRPERRPRQPTGPRATAAKPMCLVIAATALVTGLIAHEGAQPIPLEWVAVGPVGAAPLLRPPQRTVGAGGATTSRSSAVAWAMS